MLKEIQIWNNYVSAKKALIDYNLNRSYKSSVADFSEWLVAHIFSGILSENKSETGFDVETLNMLIQVKSISKKSGNKNGYKISSKDINNKIATHYAFVYFVNLKPVEIYLTPVDFVRHFKKKQIKINDLRNTGYRIDYDLTIFNMENADLKEILLFAIDDIYNNDFHLIQNNLSERAIAHRLANYLEQYLVETNLNVDCEYNGDVDNPNGYRKRIEVLSDELSRIGRKYSEDDITTLSVFPDIIIHRRGDNDNNKLIIEIKKNFPGFHVDEEFDNIKLYHYTSNYHGNNLKYDLGAYIEFDTLTDNKSFRIKFYENGKIIEEIASPQQKI